jgi:uncharacterized damage-inducible protein DinB
MAKTLTQQFLTELESEAPASRKCLERLSMDMMGWAPHEKSMKTAGLAVMTADIPQWIATMVTDGVVDFATYPQFDPKSAQDLVDHLDKSMAAAKAALESLNDEDLGKTFKLQNGGQVLWETNLMDAIPNTINHWVHHRGQLTVYMRLKGLPIPSLYGPSADEQQF